jgi:predicted metal-dependent HD superfamily phosphohydrolase
MDRAQADYAGAITHALDRLRAELPLDLLYHSLWHTQDDVLPATLHLARLSDVQREEDLQLLEVAAAYHDLGFIEQAENHELISARIVAQTLPAFGFVSRQIEQIMGLIVATRLPQAPRNLLEQILADADLDVLGREDFFPRNEILRQEFARLGRTFTPAEWDRRQFDFLQRHTYFTAAARTLREPVKQMHIAQLAARLQASP